VHFNTAADVHSLYIHWPFCPYKCHFCPFVALASHDQFMGQYHKALLKEIDIFCAQSTQKYVLKTLYLGGGTPSTIPDELLLDTSGKLRDVFIFDSQCEITIEVNPGTIRQDQLKVWKEFGINRLSIGVQSLNDAALKKLNRHQTAQEVYAALDQVSQYFENVSVDFILGLPEISADEWKRLISTAISWPIKHISVYFLMVHEDTPLYFGVKKNRITLPCDDEVVDLFYWTVETLKQAGFEHYEISNFAQPGYQSRHNTVYWDRKPYKGFGLGACEFDGQSRFQNEKNLSKYIGSIERGQSVTTFAETLTKEQVFLEKIMLGLRCSKGIAFDELTEHLTDEQKKEVAQKISIFKQDGFVTEVDGRLLLMPKGLAVENDIVIKLSL
jgi:oxygen-independent coproporphyrinogen-3 oxidase